MECKKNGNQNGNQNQNQQNGQGKGKKGRKGGKRPSRSSPVASVPATLLVRMPAQSTLTVRGASKTSQNGYTVVRTKPLTEGRIHLFTAKVETQQGGQTVVIQKNFVLKAGQARMLDLRKEAVTAVVRK
jgi:hypothetical protein